jgi:hypothetical protein
MSSEVAGYADSNHVYVFTPTIAGIASSPTAGWTFGARYLVDVVSAASVDIVSTASRRWEEVRHAASLDGGYRFGDWGVTGNANVSDEPDYVSIGASGAVSRDLLDKNLTLSLGYNHRHDIIGRRDTSFDVFSRKLDINGIKGGLTIVADRATLVTVVTDLIFENGDPSKPYRYVPMFAPGVAETIPKGASIDFVNQTRLSARVLEQLPLSRTRYVVAGKLAHRFGTTTLRLEERGYTDSWGLRATTTDALVLFDFARRAEIGPHLRFHAQAPVDFWQRAYVARGLDFPAIRTGDRELGPLMHLTAGGTARFFLGRAEDPRTWILGIDGGVTSTHYFDDLYITSRLAGLGSLSLEVGF